MVQEEAYEKISSTAKLVAHIRSFTDIPFAREIAVASGAEKDFQTLTGKSADFMTESAFNLEARYKATDQIIARYHITQVLEIAAGLSPRGLVMTEDPNVVYVATDLPEILEQEKAIAESVLAKMNMHRPNLHFRISNALDRELVASGCSFSIRQAYCDNHGRLASLPHTRRKRNFGRQHS
ncbi:MAG: hypothetical protein ACXV6K_07440 [Halobacteriota archaeon]